MIRSIQYTSAYLLLISLFFFLISSASAQSIKANSLTLEDCLVKGRAENLDLKSKMIEVDEAHEGVRGAWGAFLPTVNLNYSNKNLHNNSSSELNTDYVDQEYIHTSATLIQPLFTGFAGVSEVKRAKLALEFRKQEEALTWLKLSRDIRRDFYTVLFGQELERLWRESIERLNRQQEIAQAWYDRQMISKVQLLEVDVELSNAILQSQETYAKLTSARARLARWLAISPSEEFELVGPLNMNEENSFPSLNQCLSIAMDERPELKMAHLTIGMAEQDVRGVAARSLPHASMEFAWNDIEQNYKNTFIPDASREYYSVGLNVSMALFDGGRNIFAFRQSRLVVEKMRYRDADERQNIETEVRTYFTQWRSAAARINAAAEALNQAEIAWRLTGQSLELGVGSQRDLLDAELRLTRADINRLQAMFNRQVRFADLLYSLGRVE